MNEPNTNTNTNQNNNIVIKDEIVEIGFCITMFVIMVCGIVLIGHGIYVFIEDNRMMKTCQNTILENLTNVEIMRKYSEYEGSKYEQFWLISTIPFDVRDENGNFMYDATMDIKIEVDRNTYDDVRMGDVVFIEDVNIGDEIIIWSTDRNYNT